jgi:hypothetical protein
MNADQVPRCDPSFLGPLTDEPVVTTGPSRCFEGEERYFSKSKIDDRERMWQAIAPHLVRVLEDDETVLHVMPALHVPSIWHQLGFGVWWSLFNRTAVVLTDRRLVEVAMRDWRRAGTRICSYSWDQIRKLKLSMGTLTLTPADGRTQKWRLTVRGDRKLVKLLLPKLQELPPIDIHVPHRLPVWHCPICGTATATHPRSCAQCGTQFKSTTMAALLAVAFPGAGLLYAGHPVLAAMDLLGEVLLFILAATGFLVATSTDDIVGAVIVALILFAVTKLESMHLATTLVKRTVPDANPSRWRSAAAAGAVVSLILMAGPPALSGAFAERLDSDLDLTGNTLGWSGGYDSDSWLYGADTDQRSEWTREGHPALFVFSMADTSSVAATESTLQAAHEQTQVKLFGGLDCVRSTAEIADDEGHPMLWVRWFLFDHEHDDVHIVAASVWPGDLEQFETEVETLVQTATWKPIEP